MSFLSLFEKPKRTFSGITSWFARILPLAGFGGVKMLGAPVTPFPTPLRKGVDITVHAEDTATEQTVPGTVRLENFNQQGGRVVQEFPTDVPTRVFLRTRRVREPDGSFDIQLPWTSEQRDILWLQSILDFQNSRKQRSKYAIAC
jgi:hypothetical protein